MSGVGGITICQQNKEHNFTFNNFEILFFIFNAIPFNVVFCLFDLLLAECGQCRHKTVLCLFRSIYSISCHYMILWSIYYSLLLEVYSNTTLYNFFKYYQPFNVITYKSFYLHTKEYLMQVTGYNYQFWSVPKQLYFTNYLNKVFIKADLFNPGVKYFRTFSMPLSADIATICDGICIIRRSCKCVRIVERMGKSVRQI